MHANVCVYVEGKVYWSRPFGELMQITFWRKYKDLILEKLNLWSSRNSSGLLPPAAYR